MIFAYAAFTLYGAPFQETSTNHQIGNSTVAGPTTPPASKTQSTQISRIPLHIRTGSFSFARAVLSWLPLGCRRFGLFRFRSPLLSESRFLSFPSGTEMVHFPEFALARLCIQRVVIRVYRIGFPHSDIPGSKPACGSPRLIAACHVLHRHRLPRHPPCALSSLTTKFTQPIRLRGCAS